MLTETPVCVRGVADPFGFDASIVDRSGRHLIGRPRQLLDREPPQTSGDRSVTACAVAGRRDQRCDAALQLTAGGFKSSYSRSTSQGAELIWSRGGVSILANDGRPAAYGRSGGGGPGGSAGPKRGKRRASRGGMRYREGVRGLRGRGTGDRGPRGPHHDNCGERSTPSFDIALDGGRRRRVRGSRAAPFMPLPCQSRWRKVMVEWRPRNMAWDGHRPLVVARVTADGRCRQTPSGRRWMRTIFQPGWVTRTVAYTSCPTAGVVGISNVSPANAEGGLEGEARSTLWAAEFGSTQWGSSAVRAPTFASGTACGRYSRDGAAVMAASRLWTPGGNTPVATEVKWIGPPISMWAANDHVSILLRTRRCISRQSQIVRPHRRVDVLKFANRKMSSLRGGGGGGGYRSAPPVDRIRPQAGLTAFGLSHPPAIAISPMKQSCRPRMCPCTWRDRQRILVPPSNGSGPILDQPAGFAVLNVKYGR